MTSPPPFPTARPPLLSPAKEGIREIVEFGLTCLTPPAIYKASRMTGQVTSRPPVTLIIYAQINSGLPRAAFSKNSAEIIHAHFSNTTSRSLIGYFQLLLNWQDFNQIIRALPNAIMQIEVRFAPL